MSDRSLGCGLFEKISQIKGTFLDSTSDMHIPKKIHHKLTMLQELEIIFDNATW